MRIQTKTVNNQQNNVIYLSANWTGLCNQLFAIANGIANSNNITTFYIGSFAPELGSNKRIPVSQIIDLAETGKKLCVILKDYTGENNARATFGWYTKNTSKFNNVLKCITFNEKIINLAKQYIIPDTELFSVVHFRIEEDALKHWSKQNKMSIPEFEKLLHSKYNELVNKYIPQNSIILTLTHDVDNILIKNLAKNYKITNISSEKYLNDNLGFAGRESCAILDLILGENCNNIFIGCHNFKLSRGSTFSYTLWHRMKKVKMGIFIDLDDLKNEAEIIQNYF